MDDEPNRQAPRQRRSTLVPLSIVGVAAAGIAALASTGSGPAKHRHLYATRAACERDYAPSECAETVNGGRPMIAGPAFIAGSRGRTTTDPGPGRGGGAIAGTETISTRGGFGSLGRVFGAGG